MHVYKFTARSISNIDVYTQSKGYRCPIDCVIHTDIWEYGLTVIVISETYMHVSFT